MTKAVDVKKVGAIVRIRGLYCRDTQQQVIDFINRHLNRFEPALCYAGGEGAPKLDESTLKASVLKLGLKPPPEYRDMDRLFHRMVGQAVDAYMGAVPELPLAVKEDEGYIINKYEVGEYIKNHADSNGGLFRRLSFIYYANEGYVGGELRFPAQNVVVVPKQGDVVLFPSGYSHPHESTPIEEGIKCCVVTWLR